MTPLPSLPARSASCPPAVELERVSAGEDVPAVSAHVSTCEACRTYVERLTHESTAFVSARPAERFLSQLETRATTPAPKRSRGLLVVSLASVAALLLVLLLPRIPSGPAVLFKGSLVSISLKRGDQVTALRDGDVLREGDALRFSVKSERAGHALVLNRDGQGKVTVVAPFNARAPQGVPEGTTVLDDSAVLDATRGKETFVTVFAPTPFDVASVVKQLEAGQPVTCTGCVVEVSTFDKP
ncbi:MAG: DUF4384 domain-containing protein [Myxococcales bacterium]|nr:DUF4384 domain-containing protein [Myxococcales bacterium]